MEHQTILFCDAEVRHSFSPALTCPFVTLDRVGNETALLPREKLISFDVPIESFEVWTAQFRAPCYKTARITKSLHLRNNSFVRFSLGRLCYIHRLPSTSIWTNFLKFSGVGENKVDVGVLLYL